MENDFFLNPPTPLKYGKFHPFLFFTFDAFPKDDSKDVKNTVSNTNMETLADDEHALKEDTEQKETVMNLFTVLSEKCEVCDKTLLKHETMMEHLVINHLDRYVLEFMILSYKKLSTSCFLM